MLLSVLQRSLLHFLIESEFNLFRNVRIFRPLFVALERYRRLSQPMQNSRQGTPAYLLIHHDFNFKRHKNIRIVME